jgi:accessory colonization factor AcfC
MLSAYLATLGSEGSSPAETRGAVQRVAPIHFSGSGYRMTDFIQRDLPGLLKPEAVRTLHLRPSAIQVRLGNPKGL